ncbi:MAG: hypothetical protein J3R72DRAFT_455010 [Linnemannia gamsii]|nr:MAG: hypothetical protein J3R72DRAFT_455010 [Linnemannia gamsii]
MARKCTSIRRLSSKTPEFRKYSSLFLKVKLHRLYQLTYDDFQDSATDGWSGADFFHGTGHCGCLNLQLNNRVDKNKDITVEELCSSSASLTACATRGILSYGYLDTCLVSAGGHFFSPRIAVAHAWARFRSPANQPVVPIFVCKARNICQKWVESSFVESENDIMPCYLAIASY